MVDLVVQRPVRRRAPQAGGLRFKLLQPLLRVTRQTAVLVPPALERDLPHTDRRDCVRNRPPLIAKNLYLPRLRNDPFRMVSLPRHRRPPARESHTSRRSTSKGAHTKIRARAGFSLLEPCVTLSRSRDAAGRPGDGATHSDCCQVRTRAPAGYIMAAHTAGFREER
jgi:hypothetical protein